MAQKKILLVLWGSYVRLVLGFIDIVLSVMSALIGFLFKFSLYAPLQWLLILGNIFELHLL